MRASTLMSALLSVSAFSAPALALLLPPRDEPSFNLQGKRMPHIMGAIDLGLHEDSSGDLEKRRNVDYCIQDPARSGVCVAAVGLVSATAIGIAGLLKTNSDHNDCTTHAGAIDRVHWKVYATGQNCDTTAELRTIQGALREYLEAQDERVCGVHCIKLTHGGTWTGYVTLAPEGEDLDTYYCGSSSRFGECGSGGEGDA